MRGTIVTATLGEYIRQLMRGRTYRDVAAGTKTKGTKKVSRGTIQQIVAGETLSPGPETLASLALYFGSSDQEQRQIYAEMMRLAGYLELMPNSHTLHTNQMRQGNRDIEGELDDDEDDEDDEDGSV